MQDNRRKILTCICLVWLMISSAALLMPAGLSGKYKSSFSRTVDIVVCPDLTMEGASLDGAVINDTLLMNCRNTLAGTPSEATPSGATSSEATPSETTPSGATLSEATPSEKKTAANSNN